MDEYRVQNRRVWDRWAALHPDSAFYDADAFKAGRSTLDPIAAEAFGDVSGRTLLHLQCHFGLDSLSWARAGARVTGVDFAPEAIRQARRLAEETRLPARFLESDVYSLPEKLEGQFDCVFVSHGALCWLPDIAGWARVVSHFLAPGGRFFLLEGHPVLWTLDDERQDELLVIRFPYLERQAPMRYESVGTYAVPEDAARYVTYEWNHGLGEIASALIEAGLEIEAIREYPFVGWKALAFMREREDGYWELPEGFPELALSYAVHAHKRAR